MVDGRFLVTHQHILVILLLKMEVIQQLFVFASNDEGILDEVTTILVRLHPSIGNDAALYFVHSSFV